MAGVGAESAVAIGSITTVTSSRWSAMLCRLFCDFVSKPADAIRSKGATQTQALFGLKHRNKLEASIKSMPHYKNERSTAVMVRWITCTGSFILYIIECESLAAPSFSVVSRPIACHPKVLRCRKQCCQRLEIEPV